MATKRTGKPRIKTSHQTGEKRRPVSRRNPRAVERPPREIGIEAQGPSTRKTSAQPRAEVAPSIASEASRMLAIEVAIAALEKKALGIEILDVAGKVDYTDFLVLMTGRSAPHVAALAQGIEDALRTKKNKRAVAVEGMSQARWVLMDFGDVVVHVFQEDARSIYDLEGLWMDAHKVPLPAGVDEGD